MNSYSQKKLFAYMGGPLANSSSSEDPSQAKHHSEQKLNQAFEDQNQKDELILKENVDSEKEEKDKRLDASLSHAIKALDVVGAIEMTFEKEDTKESLKKIVQKKNESTDKNKVHASVKSSKRKHYKMNFDSRWLKKDDDHYKDWVQRADEDDKFFDLACQKMYDCEYLSSHEKTESHKKCYKDWTEATKGNKRLDEDIALATRISSIQCKIVLFLIQKNAPLSWAEDVEELLKTCFPDKIELNYTNLYPRKCNWIADSLANSQKVDTYERLKTQAFSLLFDETSTNKYKYGAFIARVINHEFTSVENLFISLFEVPKGDAESIYGLYAENITKKNIEKKLVALCLDNCNVMRGKSNSLVSKVRERKPFLDFPPCLLHILNICEKSAFEFIPDEIEQFYRYVYTYFSSSLKRSSEFIKLQKKLDISPTLINQPSHTRWLSWQTTISRIIEKWEALVKYFSDKGSSENNPRKFRRLIKLSDLARENSDEVEKIERWTTKAEEFIKQALKKEETYYYTIFLNDLLKHSSSFVKLFERDDLDVTTVYDHQLNFLSFYINRLRKFEHLGQKVEFIMRNISTNEFDNLYLMTEKEYEEDFISHFPKIDLSRFGEEEKKIFLNNTKGYYKTILLKFKEYVDLENNLFKSLKVLNVLQKSEEDIKIWKLLSNQFAYLFNNDHSEFKREFSEFLNMNTSSITTTNTVLQWKEINGMKAGGNKKFNSLIKLVQGLLTIPYSNAAIERTFSQLKLIKNNRRLQLSVGHLESFMILKNITKAVKTKKYDSLCDDKTLKRVKNNIEVQQSLKFQKEKEESKNKKETLKNKLSNLVASGK